MASLIHQLDDVQRRIAPLTRTPSLHHTLLYRGDIAIAPGIRTLLCVPFSARGLRYVLTVVSGLPNDFGRDERRVIETLARTTGYALSRQP